MVAPQSFIPPSVATLIQGYSLQGFATSLALDGITVQLFRDGEAVGGPTRVLVTYTERRAASLRSGMGAVGDFTEATVEAFDPWYVREDDVLSTPDGFDLTVVNVLPIDGGIQMATVKVGEGRDS